MDLITCFVSKIIHQYRSSPLVSILRDIKLDIKAVISNDSNIAVRKRSTSSIAFLIS